MVRRVLYMSTAFPTVRNEIRLNRLNRHRRLGASCPVAARADHIAMLQEKGVLKCAPMMTLVVYLERKL